MYSLSKVIRTISLIGAFGFVTLSPMARAVDSPPDGGYSNQTTAEGEDARALVPLRVRTNWAQAEFDAGHTLHNKYENVLNPSNVGRLELAWTAQVIGGFTGTPIVARGRVYIAGGDNKMHAFDEATGVELWASQEELLFPPGQSAAMDGLVFADAFDGRLRAYEAETGLLAWISGNRGFGAWPTVIKHVLYMAGFEGTLYAFDTRSRARIWSAPGGCCVQGAPAIDSGRVFQMRTEHSLTAYDASTGSELWTADTFAVGTIAAVDGKLFYVYYPNVVARDQATGAVIWQAPVVDAAVSASPAVADGLVIAQTGNGLVALDENTGDVIWTAPAASDWSPSIANGVVYSSNLSGEWDAYNELDGSLLWSVTISSGCFGSCTNAIPVVANGTLFLNGPDDYLRAYRVSP